VGQFHEKYLIDENGQRVGVLIDIPEYQRILEELEELESMRAYDAAKTSGDKSIPFEEALRD
jgi:PHD/YefM family antitoxin component YafN of YafNO toxin-antitoxin module